MIKTSTRFEIVLPGVSNEALLLDVLELDMPTAVSSVEIQEHRLVCHLEEQIRLEQTTNGWQNVSLPVEHLRELHAFANRFLLKFDLQKEGSFGFVLD